MRRVTRYEWRGCGPKKRACVGFRVVRGYEPAESSALGASLGSGRDVQNSQRPKML